MNEAVIQDIIEHMRENTEDSAYAAGELLAQALKEAYEAAVIEEEREVYFLTTLLEFSVEELA